MKNNPVVLAALLALLAACATSPEPVPVPAQAPAPARGNAPGYPGIQVCVDANANVRCDEGEPSATTDAQGGFDLPRGEALLALVGEAGALVLRVPSGAPAVLSPIATELAAMVDANGGSLPVARAVLAQRLQVAEDKLFDLDEPRVTAEQALLVPRIAAAVAEAGAQGDLAKAMRRRLALDAIDTLVVIYTEGRAFDTLYGLFPGANGIPGRNPSARGTVAPQLDRDGSVLPVLPPTWGGVTDKGQRVAFSQAQSVGLPNGMFQIDDPKGIGKSGVSVPMNASTREPGHRFYGSLMQGSGSTNDHFAAYSDAGGLAMGYYDGSPLAMWKVAQRYTLADNFFTGAFGGAFLNHHYLVCACAPAYPDAENSPAKRLISEVELDDKGDFVRLVPAADMPPSALAGPPRQQRDGALSPKDARGVHHAVNTMQPPFQPSGAPAPAGADPRLADASRATTLPPQTRATIADLLDAKGISWAWYAGGWNVASAPTPEARTQIYRGAIAFMPHHQPFNYFAAFDPLKQPDYRAKHLKDFDNAFLADAAAGTLPAVSFYKPQGNLARNPGDSNLTGGDVHIAQLIAKLEASPQWPRMLVVVTSSDHGGFYDHAPVPKGDRWGPGPRVPAIVISPFAKKGFVDSTPYDTGSILRFITHRWSLAPLPGIAERDKALQRNGAPAMGDLTNALEF